MRFTVLWRPFIYYEVQQDDRQVWVIAVWKHQT